MEQEVTTAGFEDVWGGITDEELQNIDLDHPCENQPKLIGTDGESVDTIQDQVEQKKDDILKIQVQVIKDGSPLHYLRHGYLCVSDFSNQHWCEQKMFYKLTVPTVEVISPAIMMGKSVHLARELAVHDIVEVEVSSKEDSFAIKLLNMLLTIDSIFIGTSVCREIPIFGIPFDKDIYVTGIIDELKCDQETFQLDLIELKTRSKFKSLPGKSQRESHKLQIMLYKKLFDDLVKGIIDKEVIAKHLRLDLNKSLGESVMLHKTNFSLDCIKTLNGLFDLVFGKMKAFPFISQLFIEYCSQDDNSTIGLDEIVYDEVWLKSTLDYYIAYWKGERPLQGVDIEDSWKCQMCEFADMCTWRAQKALEYSKPNIKK